MSPRSSRRRAAGRVQPRSFTLRERTAIDGLARNDTATARAVTVPSRSRSGGPVGADREPSSSIGRATGVMAVGTLLSRVTGLLRLLAAAYALGYGPLSDAFNLANNTPNIVHDLVLGGVLSATFVPLFVDRLSNRTEEEATETISAVVSLASIVLVVATVAFVLAAPGFIDLYSIGTHLQPAERAVAIDLLRLFALQLLGYGAISLMTALLNTKRRFALPAFVPILNNLIAIGVLVEFHVLDAHPNLAAGVSYVGAHRHLLILLGLGTTAGVLVQAIALVPSTFRCGLAVRPRFAPRNEGVREIAHLSTWTLGFVLANQAALFVTLALAVHVLTSAATAYTYAFVFFQLPYGMIAVSVMSAVTPELAQRWSSGERDKMARHFGTGMSRMMAGIWPATFGYLVMAGPIMALLLHHGAARASGASLTASLLAMLALGLPGYCCFLLAIRALQAMRDTRTAFFLYLFENGLNIVLAFVLTAAIGARGLALSLSIAYSAAAVAALVVVRSKMGGLGGRVVGRFVGRSFGLSVVMAIAVAAVTAAVGATSGIGLVERVVVGVATGLVVYAGGASLAGASSGWQTATEGRGRARKGT